MVQTRPRPRVTHIPPKQSEINKQNKSPKLNNKFFPNPFFLFHLFFVITKNIKGSHFMEKEKIDLYHLQQLILWRLLSIYICSLVKLLSVTLWHLFSTWAMIIPVHQWPSPLGIFKCSFSKLISVTVFEMNLFYPQNMIELVYFL